MKFRAQVVVESKPFEALNEFSVRAEIAEITRQVATILFPDGVREYRIHIKEWEPEDETL